MEITVTTSKYDAQKLQQQLNPNGAIMCIVMPGDQPHQHVIIVDEEIVHVCIMASRNYADMEWYHMLDRIVTFLQCRAILREERD